MLKQLFLLIEVSLDSLVYFLLCLHGLLDHGLDVGLFAVHEFAHL